MTTIAVRNQTKSDERHATRQAYWIIALTVAVAIGLVYVIRSQPNLGNTSINGSTLSNPGPSAPTTD